MGRDSKQGQSKPVTSGAPLDRLVKDTSAWSNKKEALETEQAALRGVEAGLAELDEQGIAARIAAAAAARDEAQAESTRHANAAPHDMLIEPVRPAQLQSILICGLSTIPARPRGCSAARDRSKPVTAH